jgi:hypothetical protein
VDEFGLRIFTFQSEGSGNCYGRFLPVGFEIHTLLGCDRKNGKSRLYCSTASAFRNGQSMNNHAPVGSFEAIEASNNQATTLLKYSNPSDAPAPSLSSLLWWHGATRNIENSSPNNS